MALRVRFTLHGASVCLQESRKGEMKEKWSPRCSSTLKRLIGQLGVPFGIRLKDYGSQECCQGQEGRNGDSVGGRGSIRTIGAVAGVIVIVGGSLSTKRG